MDQNPCVPILSKIYLDNANRSIMDRSGRKSITIDAPIMITSNKIAVWMDEDWMHDFFDFLKDNKIKLSALQHKQRKLKLTFVTAHDCTIFGLKYAGRKK